MKTDFRPKCVHFVKETEKGLKYDFGNLVVDLEISDADKKLATDFLYLCNGKYTLEELAEKLSVKVSILIPLANVLSKHKIIIDSRKLFTLNHEAGFMPGPYQYDFSNDDINVFKDLSYRKIQNERGDRLNRHEPAYLTELLRSRKSDREFENMSVPFSKIEKILQGLYIDSTRHLVPSAGAFYPLEFYVILNYDYGKFKSGLYKYNHLRNELVNLHTEVSLKLNKFLFSSNVVENTSVIIFVVANHELLNLKYANRAYRFLLLESGHVSQNAYLLAASENVGIVEHGAFNDSAVSSYLNLSPDQFCSTTLLLGTKRNVKSTNVIKNKTKTEKDKFFSLYTFLTQNKILKNIEVFSYHKEDYVMFKYAALATSFKSDRNGSDYSTCGVGNTVLEAQIKCLVEMYERYACGFPRVDKEVVYKDQKNFFSISASAQQNNNFLKEQGLSQLLIGEKVKCVEGVDIQSGKKIFVPIDEVFYPYKQAKFYRSNSSGVAAHYSWDLAFKNAFYELIERDAILIAWYTKRVPNILQGYSLGDDVKFRVKTLERNKLRVDFLDLTIDSYPVILCLIHSDHYPKTSVGCSANIDVNIAIEKALDEAELMYNSWTEKAIHDTAKSAVVKTIIDHGNVFARVNLSNSEHKWILSGKKIKSLKVSPIDFEYLIKKFEPKVVTIDKQKELGLFVVRVMSHNLLPLTFGFGSEHYGHPRLKELYLSGGSEYPLPPHFIP